MPISFEFSKSEIISEITFESPNKLLNIFIFLNIIKIPMNILTFYMALNYICNLFNINNFI